MRTSAALAALACVAALTAALPAPAVAGPDRTSAPDTKLTLTVDGRARTATVHLPTPMPDIKKVPLVMAFHGRLGDGEAQEKLSHFNQVADQKGFIAVYPDGYQRSWNDGRKDTPANRDGVRDVAFVRALIKRLGHLYPVDKRQVFAVGMSNGGFFAQRLGCVMANQFAAIATVASVMPKALAKRCQPARPIPVLMIMGTKDPLVPYQGGGFGKSQLLSAKASAKLWRTLADCAKPTKRVLRDRDPNDGTTVHLLAATHCKGRAAVKLYSVIGGGHTWPGGEQYLSKRVIGPTCRDFDAGRTIWTFFGDKRLRLSRGGS